MQMVWPAPTRGTRSPSPSAPSTSQRKAAARSARKLTNGPAALAEARSSVGWNPAATSAAMAAGDFFRAWAAAKQPTAKSPSSARGGASTLSRSTGAPVAAATAWAAAWANGLGADMAAECTTRPGAIAETRTESKQLN